MDTLLVLNASKAKGNPHNAKRIELVNPIKLIIYIIFI